MPPRNPRAEEDLTAGVVKDTTHIAVIDRAGNVFDSTPSGAWIPTSPILGRTGIAMSVRGESFWLDPSRAGQLRPRSRPRYTLTPTIVLRNGQPFLAIGTPGGDNQEQTILQSFLNIVEFWPEWYPNLHDAFRWPRVQTLHFYGSFWPHPAGFNKLNVESDMPEAVYEQLKTKGHDVSKIAPASIPSCATAVLARSGTANRIARRDTRREGYAIAYEERCLPALWIFTCRTWPGSRCRTSPSNSSGLLESRARRQDAARHDRQCRYGLRVEGIPAVADRHDVSRVRRGRTQSAIRILSAHSRGRRQYFEDQVEFW